MKYGNLHLVNHLTAARDKGGLLDWGDHEARILGRYGISKLGDG